ncbi:3-phosphoshikimate 1-carboxyvinyltransferase [Sandaracinobacteroides saxicola]|uniref:3-phosphoshikimate 1-carboxyvinyltransferase n=1 Tax=Sandaracinobacteroides saxicola TaxID=2759707 RepID=A0A7G5IJN7_9SPHN|nr:3-phosphoshikimate 1-carboxyvinyltransferase [Sandaracinobacteroides saxicola]QMW23579.1 3-phosphoshikimate 1-carboxyvinyltransferase [Sandaracinobacteroides saxicola]
MHAAPRPLTLAADGPLSGHVRVPGDKSISHRALMLSALAVGTSRVSGLLEGEDVLATAAALRACGAGIDRQADGDWLIDGVGVGGLLQPLNALDMGNSGTSTRLLMGLFASHALTVTFVGDASLSRRPMQRVIDPLRRMGADISASPGGRLPLMQRGLCPAIPIVHDLPVASAQVKSAVLLAGLNAPGATTVIERTPTRDHSERMLAGFGAEVTVEPVPGGSAITVRGGAELRPRDIVVPGDPSSAAFPAVAALIVPGSEVLIEGVGLNPTRDGLYRVLAMMGADIARENSRLVGGEPVADLRVRAGPLIGIEVPPEVAPSMIDEYPILFVAAALASGRTVMRGIEELRVKESDRIATMAAGLRACGVECEEVPDGLIVTGRDGAPVPGGATVASMLDHRIAMSFAVLGLRADQPVIVDDAAPIATSFPDFLPLMTGLGARVG